MTDFKPQYDAVLIGPETDAGFDLYLSGKKPKIFFLGSGSEWKNQVIQHFTNNWTEDPIVMCYYPGQTTNALVPWIHFNLTNSDFLFYHLTLQTDLDLFMLGRLSEDPRLFISTDSEFLRILCGHFNGNTIRSSPIDHLENVKMQWRLNGRNRL